MKRLTSGFTYSRISFSHVLFYLSFLGLLAIYPHSAVYAVIPDADDWIGGSGNWNVAANWNSNPNLPGSADNAVIDRPTPVVVTHSTGTDSIKGLYNENTLNVAGGSLSVANGIYLSYLGADSTLNLSSSGAIASKEQYVGWNGKGTFVQNGGTNHVTDVLEIGVNPGGIGAYRLTGGYMTTYDLLLGSAGGVGVFEQTQGFNDASHAIYLGGASDPASSGQYTFANGLLNIPNGKVHVGQVGQGVFAMNGGTMIAEGIVLNAATGTFSSASGSSGLLIVNELTGFSAGLTFNGSLAIGHYQGSASGSYSISAGRNLNVSRDLTVGLSAPCLVNQTGGTCAVGDRIYIGRNAGSFGTYELEGGSLTADEINVGFAGGTGVFLQSGGSNTLSGNLSLGSPTSITSSGGYSISGGSLSVQSGKIKVGQTGPGAFELSGGSVSAGELIVGTNGTFDWTDGTLTLPAGTPIVNDGAFQVLAGDHSVERIQGGGTTKVTAGSLTAESIVQDTLIIGAATGGSAAVPEPGSLALTVSAIFAAMFFARRRQN
jgi:hypothetical protein